VLPKGDGKQKQKPPKARFVWQDLQIDGIIEDLSIDFDLFASDGTPLRAKMSVTMKEQDAKYQLGKTGPGANTASGATLPGASAAGPGSFGASLGLSAGIGASAGLGAGVSLGLGASASASAGLTDSTRAALSGESAAEFAARNGLDPAAWRGVTGNLDSTLSLKGGVEVDFNASVSSAAGVGVAVGVEAGASASLEASFGLDVRGAVPTPAGIALGAVGASAGFALASAGGVSAAIETVNGLKAGSAAAAAKEAFRSGTTTGPPAQVTRSSATPAPPDQSRMPLAITGLPSATEQAAAPSAPLPPVADPRATTFGFGVPLRARITGAADVRRGTLAGSIPLRPRERASDAVSPTTDPTAPPWTRLPADTSRAVADAAQRARRPSRPCGCLGPCGHGGPR
jgi:contractile injection system tube protein